VGEQGGVVPGAGADLQDVVPVAGMSRVSSMRVISPGVLVEDRPTTAVPHEPVSSPIMVNRARFA
jgi:hypothetical protein